jgi:hypothetical protein
LNHSGASDTFLTPVQLAQLAWGNGSTPIPFLATNVNFRGGLFNSTITSKSVVRTLPNGVKIGLLGVFDVGAHIFPFAFFFFFSFSFFFFILRINPLIVLLYRRLLLGCDLRHLHDHPPASA